MPLEGVLMDPSLFLSLVSAHPDGLCHLELAERASPLLLDGCWPQGSWLDLWSPTTVEVVEVGCLWRLAWLHP